MWGLGVIRTHLAQLACASAPAAPFPFRSMPMATAATSFSNVAVYTRTQLRRMQRRHSAVAYKSLKAKLLEVVKPTPAGPAAEDLEHFRKRLYIPDTGIKCPCGLWTPLNSHFPLHEDHQHVTKKPHVSADHSYTGAADFIQVADDTLQTPTLHVDEAKFNVDTNLTTDAIYTEKLNAAVDNLQDWLDLHDEKIETMTSSDQLWIAFATLASKVGGQDEISTTSR